MSTLAMKAKVGVASTLAIALAVGGLFAGATAASAAPAGEIGSDGPVFVRSADTGDALVEGTTYTWDDQFFVAPDPVEIVAFAPLSSEANTLNYFVAPRGQERVPSAWKASGYYGSPTPTGELLPTLSLVNFTDGDWAGLKTNGGLFSVGFTGTGDGIRPTAKAYYFHIDVKPGGNWTFVNTTADAEEAFPNWSGFSATPGAVKLAGGNLLLAAGAANAGKTVDVYAEGTEAPVNTGVVLDGSGAAIIAGTSIAEGTRVALAEGESVLVWGTASGVVVEQPTGTPTITHTVIPEGTTTYTVTVPALAGQTRNVYAWSTPTNLGQVTFDGTGTTSVDVSSLGGGSHTVAFVNPTTNAVDAWGTIQLESSLVGETDVTVDVTASDKFALEGVAASVDLGEVRRGQVATAALPAFTVIDDRNELLGWNLTATVEDFALAGGQPADAIAKAAFGVKPQQVGTAVSGVTLGTEQVAGSATYGALFAEGALNSSTPETGTQFDATLSFKAPSSAKAGTYNSTLTLTLETKP